jgi:hypothetical protein
MSLIEHAQTELRRAGMYDADADYGPGAIAGAVMEIVEVFAKQGHSGMSAMYTLSLAEKILRFQPLTPLTSDPNEWMDQSAISGTPMWQNKRCSTCFSTDGGKTWYDLDGIHGPKFPVATAGQEGEA